MYNQLKVLETLILDIKQQYQTVSQELHQLKQQHLIDPEEFLTVKTQLESSITERDMAKKQLSDLDNRYQSLAEAHHMIGDEQDKLQKQLTDYKQHNNELKKQNKQLEQQAQEANQHIDDLERQNHDLAKKNLRAAERTQVVLNRLSQIDRVDS